MSGDAATDGEGIPTEREWLEGLPEDRVAATVAQPPTELYDLDMGAEHWIRKDLAESPAEAKTWAKGILDAEWVELRCETVYATQSPDVDDLIADGVKEPYDGWPWTSARPDDPGAVAYWHVYVKGRA